MADWQAYCRGERSDLPPKPKDIPAGPYNAYGRDFVEKGGMGAWLGTRQIPRNKGKSWRQYNEAASFVQTLKLKSSTEWKAYLRGERPDLPPRPVDLPVEPYAAYGEVFRERGGWAAWLGKDNRKDRAP